MGYHDQNKENNHISMEKKEWIIPAHDVEWLNAGDEMSLFIFPNNVDFKHTES